MSIFGVIIVGRVSASVLSLSGRPECVDSAVGLVVANLDKLCSGGLVSGKECEQITIIEERHQ